MVKQIEVCNILNSDVNRLLSEYIESFVFLCLLYIEIHKVSYLVLMLYFIGISESLYMVIILYCLVIVVN